MTIKLHALDRWSVLEAGKAIAFAASGRVRLHVNVASATTFYLEDEDGPRLLATVPAGLETIEFSQAGKFSVFAADGSGEVHYQTAEGEPTFARVVDPVIFTKIANRRHRNPELEEIMYRMQMNVERRLAQQADQFEAALSRRRKEETDGRPAERVQTNAPGAPASAGAGEVPAPEPKEPESKPDAGSKDGGKPKGVKPAGTPAPAD